METPRPTLRGRGAAHNPPNRFVPIEVVEDEWIDEESPPPETRYYKDATRSIIATNNSPDVGFEASVNPYRGCTHGCAWCVGGATPILMADGTTRSLAELRPGDWIYGTRRGGVYRRYVKTRVLAHWATRKPAYRVTLDDGTELVASGDHRFLTDRGWKHVIGTEHGGPLQRPHLTTNNRLLGIGATRNLSYLSRDYRRGYLCGMIRGDGHLAEHRYRQANGRPGRLTQFRLALVDDAGLGRTSDFLLEFGVPTRRFEFRTASPKSRRMEGIRTGAREPFERIRQIVEWPRSPSYEWSRGFLAGVFDAEGSYSQTVLRVCNTDAAIIDETSRAFRRLGFDIVLEPKKEGRKRPITNIRLRGGLQEHFRFFHLADPAILRKRDFSGRAVKTTGARLGVVSIEPLGTADLYDITTGTGDFLADGTITHNCFARPTHEFFGLSAGLDFETKIFVKEDGPALLRKAVSSPKWEPKPIVMSGVTDAYQPIERKLGITRGCLEVLAEFRNPVGIVTKSHLVTRDADLLGELAAHDAAIVNLSITSLRNEIQRAMEPRAASPARRLEAIRKLADAGIPTGVMVAPVVPGLTDHELPAILEAAAEAGAVRAGWIMLRLPHAVKELFEDWLARWFPDRRDKVLNRLRDLRGGALYDSRFGARMRGEGPYAEQVRSMFDVACRQTGLNRRAVCLSTDAFRRPASGGQMGLFDSS